MKTHELIEALAERTAPTPRLALARGLLAATGVGAVAALVLVLVWLGLRPDLAQAVASAPFWGKAGYMLALAGAGFWMVERLARPAASPRRGLVVALAVAVLAAALGAGQILSAPDSARLHLWLGGSWTVCPFNILVLSVPILIAALIALRRCAPTRLVEAGAAAGLLSGAAAAIVYGLHCTETAMAFTATWYSLGVLLAAGTGALLGPRLLRW
jgi:hypothetical protein